MKGFHEDHVLHQQSTLSSKTLKISLENLMYMAIENPEEADHH